MTGQSSPGQFETTQPRTGQALRRQEDDALLRGAVKYTADVRHEALDGALYAAFVRSPVAAGTILRIDASEAAALPGVVSTLTGHDFNALAPYSMLFGPEYGQPLLPTETIGFAGQAVAVVVAETPGQADDAAEAVVVEVSPTDPVLDLDHALDENVIEATRHRSGSDIDADPNRLDGEVVVELAQWSPRQLPAAIEGRSLAAVQADDRLLVWSATQTPHAFRTHLATLFDVEPETIRVLAGNVGGGFGGKVSRTAEEYLIPVLARRIGRPVRWDETRSEYFATATQGRGERISITLSGTNDGRISALRAYVVKDAGAYPLVGALLAAGYTSKMANGCYDIGQVAFESVAATTNRPPTSAYRGAGRSSYIAALERIVDRFAFEVGLDPVEVRRRNLIRREQMPYATVTGATYDEADYPSDLEQVLEHAGYADIRAQQAQRRRSRSRLALGVGLACYNHMTTGGGGEEASVTVEPDGSAVVVTGTTSQGHSHAVTWAQIASDVLRIDPSEIRVVEGDTDAIASGVGAVGSRSLQTAGLAIHRAATEAVDQAKELAAELLEASVDDIVLGEVDLGEDAVHGSNPGFHVVGTPAKAVSWAEVVANASGQEITCGDFYDTEGRNTFPSGAHLAVVEVDTETGKVELMRLVTVDDAGTIVNPMVVEGQLHGGVASAIGQVLGEVVIHDERGNQVTGSFMDYPIPTTDQLPSFEVHLSETASSFNPLGFKGVGESGTVGATAAVHNAVIDALAPLGVQHLDLPCTPERVWSAIQAADRPA